MLENTSEEIETIVTKVEEDDTHYWIYLSRSGLQGSRKDLQNTEGLHELISTAGYEFFGNTLDVWDSNEADFVIESEELSDGTFLIISNKKHSVFVGKFYEVLSGLSLRKLLEAYPRTIVKRSS